MTPADLPDIAESSTWIGLTGPAGMPAAIVEKLTRKVASIYADPVMAERLEKAGITPVASYARGIRRFHPQRERALGEGVQGEQPPEARGLSLTKRDLA